MQYKFLFTSLLLFSIARVHDLSLLASPELQSKDISFNFSKAANPFWDLGKTKDPATDTASLKQSNWYGEAMKGIAASEYHFKWEEKQNAYCTPNRKNNLRFFYDEDGFTVEPRTTQIPIGDFDPMARPDEIKYKQLLNWKINFNLDKKQVGKGIWRVADNMAEYVTNNITVQYINNEEGMRQNFIVHKPLSKKEELKINLSIKTKLKISLENNQIKFTHKKSGNVLNYADLKVWDAEQKPLQATFVKNEKGVYAIKVNTSDAVYPITIDPLSTGTAGTPDWIGDDADQAGAWFGVSVASAGDVNGDGYSDVIIGAYRYDDGFTDEGRAFVYHGSATGISLTPNSTPDDADQANAYFGYSVASAGDVNGDGYSDVIIGAYGYDDGANVGEGKAFVYHGSAVGLSLTPNSTPDDADQANAYFGVSVASAGDVNGDGYSDVIIGADSYDDGANTNEGRAFVYHGSAAGLSASPNSTPDDADQADALFGDSVSSAGDVNGDGYSDVIIGASYYDDGFIDEGRAFVYHGSAAGLSASPNSTPDDADQADAWFGGSVASAGDVNGDGYSDVIIGADTFDDGFIDEGKAFVYHGSATGLSTSPNNTPDDADQASARFGSSIASAGDVNGDGYSDVIIGAKYYDDGANTNEGRAFVYYGSATGLAATPNSTPDDADQFGAYFGISVASAGDVNGDGYSDVIIGAHQYDDGANTDEGRAFVYHGSAAGINTTATANVESNQASAYMGWSVASAGDVNGDGYSDVIVGALYYDNGQTDEGAAFVYHGSASGINTTAAATVESNQASAFMGWSVASAGDVNGDGYSDVIIGAMLYDNGQTDEGAAFVYHGSASGISTTAVATVASNQAYAQMGVSVASAGDVNGDGYSDVIVGAHAYVNGQTDEGAAFVYHGSATGISTTAAATVESNQVNARMGRSVASAGDVNGDGYSDVIVGAYIYDNGQTDEGAAFVYHGSATGINITPSATVERNQAGANMGFSVASAGDVNGDGYSDLIVGAPYYDNGQTDEGAAFVYHGSASGINTTATATMESNQVNAQMGFSVASAGDVNGDGYSDVIVGAVLYDNGQTDEGAAFVYHGNSPGTNKRNNLSLYNQDLVTPIGHLNVTEPNLFGAGLFAKSPLGRIKGKLVWEVKKQGDAFSGNPITNSTGYLGKQPSFTDLGIAGTELKYNVQKVGSKNNKIRTRVEYDKVTAITGQVYGPWRYPAGYTMGAYSMNSVPLPITLISFNGQFINADDVRLNWITSNEINMLSYFVERSTDGVNFTAIGELAAKGIGSNRSDYSFTDKHVQYDLLYYRLKLKEKSGEVSYTKTVTVSRKKLTNSFIAPNPVHLSNDVLLVLQSATDGNLIHINFYNSQGQLIITENKILQKGRNEITLSTVRLLKGIYIVNMFGNGIRENYRLVVQ